MTVLAVVASVTAALACYGTDVNPSTTVNKPNSVHCPYGSSITCQLTVYSPSSYITSCYALGTFCRSDRCETEPLQVRMRTTDYQGANSGCTQCTGPGITSSWVNSGPATTEARYVQC